MDERGPATEQRRVAAIVLAAGASTRLGRPKQLIAPGRDGETLLRRVTRLASESGCAPVIVVLGACDEPCREVLVGLAGMQVLHNSRWQDGMGSSLSMAVHHLLSAAGSSSAVEAPEGSEIGLDTIESVLVMVTDQARVSADSLARLLAEHERSGAPATAAFYHGRPGVPAIFRRTLFPSLAALNGDQGARFLLTGLADQVATVPMPEAAFDLDTPEDLRRLDKEG